jgi:hypothetical protein
MPKKHFSPDRDHLFDKSAELTDRDLGVIAKAIRLHRPPNRTDKEDALQEAKIAAWQSLKKNAGSIATPGDRDRVVASAAAYAVRQWRRKESVWSRDGKRQVRIGRVSNCDYSLGGSQQDYWANVPPQPPVNASLRPRRRGGHGLAVRQSRPDE